MGGAASQPTQGSPSAAAAEGPPVAEREEPRPQSATNAEEIEVYSDWPLVADAVRWLSSASGGCAVDVSGIRVEASDGVETGTVAEGAAQAPDGYDYTAARGIIGPRSMRALRLLWTGVLEGTDAVLLKMWEQRLRKKLEAGEDPPRLPVAEPDYHVDTDSDAEDEEGGPPPLDCDAIEVQGAGINEFNGLYRRGGERNGRATWVLSEGPGFAICWHARAEPACWGLHRRSYDLGSAQYRCDNEGMFPPRSGWKPVNQGELPAPTLRNPGEEPQERKAGRKRRKSSQVPVVAGAQGPERDARLAVSVARRALTHLGAAPVTASWFESLLRLAGEREWQAGEALQAHASGPITTVQDLSKALLQVETAAKGTLERLNGRLPAPPSSHRQPGDLVYQQQAFNFKRLLPPRVTVANARVAEQHKFRAGDRVLVRTGDQKMTKGVIMSQSDGPPPSYRVDTDHTKMTVNEGDLQRPPAVPGDEVSLVAAAGDVGGCLQAGEVGTVTRVDDSDVPMLVRGPRGDESWYAVQEVALPRPSPDPLIASIAEPVDPEGPVLEATDALKGKRALLPVELCTSRRLYDVLGGDGLVSLVFAGKEGPTTVLPLQPEAEPDVDDAERQRLECRKSSVVYEGATAGDRNVTAAGFFRNGDEVRVVSHKLSKEEDVHMSAFGGKAFCGRTGVVVGHKRRLGMLRVQFEDRDSTRSWAARFIAPSAPYWRSTRICRGTVRLSGTPQQVHEARRIASGLDSLIVRNAPLLAGEFGTAVRKALHKSVRHWKRTTFIRELHGQSGACTGWLVVAGAGQGGQVADALSGDIRGAQYTVKDEILRRGVTLIERTTRCRVAQGSKLLAVIGPKSDRVRAEKIIAALNDMLEIVCQLPVADVELVQAHRDDIQRISLAHVVVVAGSLVQMTGTVSHIAKARRCINALLRHHWKLTQTAAVEKLAAQVAASQAEVKVTVDMPRINFIMRRVADEPVSDRPSDNHLTPAVSLPTRGALQEEYRSQLEALEKARKQELRDMGLRPKQRASAGTCPKCRNRNLERRRTRQHSNCNTCSKRARVHCSKCSGDWCDQHAGVRRFRVTEMTAPEPAVIVQRALAAYDVGKKGYLSETEFIQMFGAMLRASTGSDAPDEESVQVYRLYLGDDAGSVMDADRLLRLLSDGSVGRKRREVLDPLLPELPNPDRHGYITAVDSGVPLVSLLQDRFRAHLQRVLDAFHLSYTMRAEWSENVASAAGNARGWLAAFLAVRAKAEATAVWSHEQLGVDMEELGKTQALLEQESEPGSPLGCVAPGERVSVRDIDGEKVRFRIGASGACIEQLRQGPGGFVGQEVISIDYSTTSGALRVTRSPDSDAEVVVCCVDKDATGGLKGVQHTGTAIIGVEAGSRAEREGVVPGMHIRGVGDSELPVGAETAAVLLAAASCEDDPVRLHLQAPSVVVYTVLDHREELTRLSEFVRSTGLRAPGLLEVEEDSATLCAAVRMTVRRQRGDDKDVQIGALEFYTTDGAKIPVESVSGGEDPGSLLVPGRGRWTAKEGCTLLAHFPSPARVHSYRLQTADGDPVKDGIDWLLEGLEVGKDEGPPTVQCPTASCKMVVTDWNGGRYGHLGWVCNECSYSGGANEDRWCCMEHCDDFCLNCKPLGAAADWVTLHEVADASEVPTERNEWTEQFRVRGVVRWWSADSKAACKRVLGEIRQEMLRLQEDLMSNRQQLSVAVRDAVARLRRGLVADARQGKWALQEHLLSSCGCLLDVHGDTQVSLCGPPAGIRRAVSQLRDECSKPWPPEDVWITATFPLPLRHIATLCEENQRLLAATQSASIVDVTAHASATTDDSGLVLRGTASSLRDFHALACAVLGIRNAPPLRFESEPALPSEPSSSSGCSDCGAADPPVQLLCGHRLCVECCAGRLRKWVQSELRSPVTCPGCDRSLSVLEFRSLIDAAPAVAQRASIDVCEYEMWGLDTAMTQTGFTVRCPSCDNIACVTDKDTPEIVVCAECLLLFCTGRGRPHTAHFSYGCALARDQRQQLKTEKDTVPPCGTAGQWQYSGYVMCDGCSRGPLHKAAPGWQCVHCLNYVLCDTCKTQGRNCGNDGHSLRAVQWIELPERGLSAEQRASSKAPKYPDSDWRQEVRYNTPWLGMSPQPEGDGLLRTYSSGIFCGDTPRDVGKVLDWSDDEEPAEDDVSDESVQGDPDTPRSGRL